MKTARLDKAEKPLRALLLIAAFIIPALTALSVFAAYGMYPFGEQSVLIMDMSGQYVEFLAGLKHLRSPADMYFNWGKVLGGNYSGVFAYYASSPLSFLTVFCPDQYMDAGLLFLTVLKIGLCGLTMALFLTKFLMRTFNRSVRFAGGEAFSRNTIRAGIVLLFSTLYALCSYNCVYSMCVMWLDGVIMLPLILYFTEVLIDRGKIAGLVACFTYIFIANYYVAFMCGVFTVIYYVFYCIDRRKTDAELALDKSTAVRFHANRFLKFVLSAILAACLAAFILLPAFFSLFEGKIGGANSSYPSDWNYSFTQFIRKLFIGEYDAITSSGAPFFYGGAAVLLAVPLFFMNRRIKVRTRISAAAILAFLLFSTALSPLDNMWHIFQHPNWFPYRWSFILTFFAVFIAFRAVLAFRFESPGAILFSVCLIGALCHAAVNMSEDKPGADHVYRQFALALIFAALIIALSLLMKFYRLKKRNTYALKTAAGLFCALALSVTVIVAAVREETYHWKPLLEGLDRAHHYETAESYITYKKEMSEALGIVDKDRNALGLSKYSGISQNFSRSYNEAVGFGYRSVAHYSSAFNRSVNDFLGKLGYSCAYLWNLDFGATAVTDSIFGLKYYLSGNGILAWDAEELVERGSPALPYEYEKIGSVDGEFGIDIYRNPYAADGPFLLGADPYGFSLTNNYFENQNALIKLCSGLSGDVFKPLDRGYITLTLPAFLTGKNGEDGNYRGSGAELEYTVILPEGGVLYAFFKDYGHEGNPSLKLRSDETDIDPIRLFRGETSCIQRLGSARPGGGVAFTIEIARSLNTNGFMFYVLDEDMLKQHMDAIKAASLNITKYGTGYIKGSFTDVSAAANGGYLLLPAAYDQGWTVKADGRKVSTSSLDGGLLVVKIPAGTKNVELRYRAKGQVAGTLLSISAFVFCASAIAATLIKKRRMRLDAGALNDPEPVDFK